MEKIKLINGALQKVENAFMRVKLKCPIRWGIFLFSVLGIENSRLLKALSLNALVRRRPGTGRRAAPLNRRESASRASIAPQNELFAAAHRRRVARIAGGQSPAGRRPESLCHAAGCIVE